MLRRKSLAEFVRYGIVGVFSNVILYVGYMALTFFGIEPKVAMTLLYGFGVLQTFLLNKRWSFRHGGAYGVALKRYVFAYLLGYAINLGALHIFVDYYGYKHHYVQAVLIVLVAFIIFAIQKYWVFRSAPGSGGVGGSHL